MAKVLFAAGIEVVSGAVNKIDKNSQHAWDENMLLFTHRKAESCSRVCQRGYYRKVNNLPHAYTPYSTEERERQLAFKTASQQVATRRNDLSKMTADQAQLKAIKPDVEANGGRITMKSFLWAAKKLMGNDFPTGAITMTAQEYLSNSYAASHNDGF